MSEREIIKHYDNGDITIKWEPSICIHAGNCVRALPEVFKPKDRPWVQMENSTTDKIKAAVDQCPSSALTYTEDNNTNPNTNQKMDSKTDIEVIKNGPYKVTHGFKLKNEDGTEEEIDKSVILCRCGASENKPYCDGSHVRIGFKG